MLDMGDKISRGHLAVLFEQAFRLNRGFLELCCVPWQEPGIIDVCFACDNLLDCAALVFGSILCFGGFGHLSCDRGSKDETVALVAAIILVTISHLYAYFGSTHSGNGRQIPGPRTPSFSGNHPRFQATTLGFRQREIHGPTTHNITDLSTGRRMIKVLLAK